MKTNACRLLDALDIQYETRVYPVDPDDLSGQTVATKIGLPPEQVFKTLLCRIDGERIVFAVLSVADELDFKKLAAAAQGRRAEMVPIRELQPLTGYIRGGVTVFGSKKKSPTLFSPKKPSSCSTPSPSPRECAACRFCFPPRATCARRKPR